jgi:hypothetical protein
MDWTWSLNFHRSSFLLGVAAGVVATSVVVVGARARRRRAGRRERDGQEVVG